MHPTERFTDRVENYRRHRPTYPVGVLDCFRDDMGLTPEHPVADIGAGTGRLTELLAGNGNPVYAVEPNAAMRNACADELRRHRHVRCVDGTAEVTNLPDASVWLAVAAQAFHWFDVEATAAEFRRIVQPGGFAALIWNTRDANRTAFLREYDSLLIRYGVHYGKSPHRFRDLERFRRFFGPGRFHRRILPNRQTLDEPGLRGRLLSSSYTPPPGHPNHAPMLDALADIFSRYAQRGRVTFSYRTEIYWGHLT